MELVAAFLVTLVATGMTLSIAAVAAVVWDRLRSRER